MRGGVWVVAIAASTTFVSAVARADCTKDLDCAGELICEGGACVAPPPASPPVPPMTTAPPPPIPTVPPRAVTTAAASPLRDDNVRFFDDEETKKARRPRRRLKHPGLLVVGIVTASGGVLMAGFGFLGLACDSGDCRNNDTQQALLLGSLGLIGIGVPMIVIGAKRENAPRVAVAPWASLGQGGLRLQLAL
jgi:hypothetical protein